MLRLWLPYGTKCGQFMGTGIILTAFLYQVGDDRSLDAGDLPVQLVPLLKQTSRTHSYIGAVHKPDHKPESKLGT